MNGTRHEKIEAERLLMAKFPHPVGEYQRGWNEALQAAFEAETGRKIKEVEEVDRKNGKWMQTDALPHHVYCSVCHKTYIPNSEWRIWENGELPRDFCPNCGADMRGET